MIANFFQSLSDHGVEYLLISGQATVLYGAATFSEDIDLWINPTAENCLRFRAALRACHVCFYKLTPPLTEKHLLRGHGFHFVLPGAEDPAVFLDVMGHPPRAGSFDAARTTARWMESDWGRLPTLGVKELVELKKTQRLEDYPIISRLALAWLEQPGCAADPADYQWAIDNVFTLAELRLLFTEHPEALLPAGVPAPLEEFARQVWAGTDPPERVETELSAWMQERIQRLQQADRRYWREIIAELRQLRAAGELMPEGAEV